MTFNALHGRANLHWIIKRRTPFYMTVPLKCRSPAFATSAISVDLLKLPAFAFQEMVEIAWHNNRLKLALAIDEVTLHLEISWKP